MPDVGTFTVFLAAAFTLLVIPGPAVLFIVTRSVEHGPAVGVASALGVASGGIVHVAGAALGLSALVVQSAVAFSMVKFAGAAYLAWLGVRRIFVRIDHAEPAPSVASGGSAGVRPVAPRKAAVTAAQAFRQGIVVNVLNPKVALFFLAFLPQFVDAGNGSTLLQTLLLGFTFLALGVLTDGTYAVVAGTVGGTLRRRVGARRRLGHRVSGLVYVGLGVSALLTRRTPATS